MNYILKGLLMALLAIPLLSCTEIDGGSVMLSTADQDILQVNMTPVGSGDPAVMINSGTPDALPEMGQPGLAFWLPGTFSSETGADYLEVNYPIFDQLDVWFETPDGLVHQVAGDTVPLDERSSRQGLLVFPVPEGSQRYVFRLQTAGFLPWSLTQWGKAEFADHAAAQSLWYGIFFGGVLVLMGYNLFLFISLRDPNYFLYVGYLGFLSMFQALRSGHAQIYIWPWGGDGINSLLLITIALGTLCGILFCNRFLSIQKRFPRWWMLSLPLYAVAIGIVVFSTQDGLYNPLLRLIAVLNICALLYYISSVIMALRNGVKQARFLLPAFGAFFIATFSHLFWTFGFLPDIYIFRHAMEYGLLAEALLLSFALADRINILGSEKREIEQAATLSQQAFSQRLITMQEQERERISNILHDSIGHGLLVMRQQLSRLAGETRAPDRSDSLRAMAEEARDVLDEVRGLSHDLHPHILQRLGLKAALESTLERAFTGTDMEYVSAIEDVDALLTQAQCLGIYRVIQEAINNVIRHANAGEIIVTLGQREQGLVSGSVKDDGRGFSRVAESSEGLGLATMEGRMKLLGGALSIDSDPGAGTSVRFELPLKGGTKE